MRFERAGLAPPAVALLAAVVIIIAVVAYASLPKQAASTISSGQITNPSPVTSSGTAVISTSGQGEAESSSNSLNDTFLTTCSPSSVGDLELQVVSDSTGTSVTGETVEAVDSLGCDIVGQPPQQQTVYIDNFSSPSEGWLVPDFPAQAIPGGQLNFTVSYLGQTYNFVALVPPVGTNCVTLHVPSGSVTSETGMNTYSSIDSYCG